MGSCYSCRSNGGPTTYTTVAMANVDDTKDKQKLPYARRNNTGSFGFKRRVPATMKSLSQERTSELVNMYESKIANVGNLNCGVNGGVPAGRSVVPLGKLVASSSSLSSIASNASASKICNVPRFAYKSCASNSSNGGSITVSGVPKLESVNGDHLENISSRNSYADNNCNDILTMHNLTSAKVGLPCKVNTLTGSPKRTSSKLLRKGGRDNSPDQLSPSAKAVPRTREDLVNGNEKRTVQEPLSTMMSKTSSTKIPFKLKTQVSGLPKPQVAVLVSNAGARCAAKDEIDAGNNLEAETQSLISIEPMQISSDTIPADDSFMYEGDSGIGTCSVSDRKTEGDTETLAEVDQIEGDSMSISSITKEKLPERMDVTIVHIEKISKKEENLLRKSQEVQVKPAKSGIARLKSALPSTVAQPKAVLDRRGSPVLTEKVYKGAVHSQSHQSKSFLKKKQQPYPGENVRATSEQSTPKSSPKRKADSQLVRKLKKEENGSSNIEKGFGSNDEWKIITEMRQKENITPDIEVEVKPINVGFQKQVSGVPSTAALKVGPKSPKIETVLPLSVFERNDNKPKHPDAPKMHEGSPSADDSAENSLNDMGPYSPPSEKDFFLIDDEIADQPALIACQSLGPSMYHGSSRDSKLGPENGLMSKLQSAYVTDMNEEGGFPALAQTSLSIKIPRRRVRSVDTLSPCSSLASDDLMLDFDRTEEGILDGSPNRPSSFILEDGGQADSQDNSRLCHASKSPMQSKSPSVGGIFAEWSQLMGSHTTEEPASSASSPMTKYRSARHTSSPSAIPMGAGACGSPDAAGYLQAARGTPSSSPSGSSFVARRSVSLRPPKQTNIVETDDGSAKIDATSYRYMCQDVTSTKTLLLRLKRVLQENSVDRADTLNPFETSTLKNGLFLNLANNDPPDGVTGNRTADCANETHSVADVEQENADLRRQVVFLQQQLEERDRTIKLLQQQMTKYTSSHDNQERKDVSNAACQTERQKSLMGSSLSSSSEESAFGSTVSYPPSQQS